MEENKEIEEENKNIEDNNPSETTNEQEQETTILSLEEPTPEPQSQINDMEVHAHSHTPRIKWSHYFWEFLMHFLAVFCGFLAEYKLEHVIENQREKTLMQSLTEDLQSDEATLAKYIKWRKEINRDFDSLLVLLSKPDIDSNAYDIYQKSEATVLRFGLPDVNEGTILQLKNAGGLRLIRKKEILNEINNHYLAITRMKSIYEVEVLLRVKLVETTGEILDAKFLIDGNNNPPDSFRLATTEKTKINSYMNSILAAKETNQKLISWLESTKVRTIKLNKHIKEEYHFQ